ncbi:DUF3120 domain-containing protein [Synechococcus sp. RSCCF101]|nr:DUF3120 domain-containing protein [Synechococcus sp. RSCCF101]
MGLSAALVSIPVFLEAPLVRLSPAGAVALTVPLVAAALLLARRSDAIGSVLAPLLLGFSGSWLAGAVFWGWFRMAPIWHLPIEAFALPLAIAGLGTRWRLAGAFYLASLVGTACTDGAMALAGVMPHWPAVLGAPSAELPQRLSDAAAACLQLRGLLSIAFGATVLINASDRLLARRSTATAVAGAALMTTIAVDGLFLLLAALSPRLSGLI